ncbi:hypothetical protein SE17_32955 [Kouleothrix aurantiaca]|uniref:Uncharacterized protein n=1 Tax=Kouleothrix aurantiaca TaxID=186479 RepID=A0A0P9EYX6_9CHLR|nr:hypothetical protein SE17_32955 [Kouleothrix aurantiaca]
MYTAYFAPAGAVAGMLAITSSVWPAPIASAITVRANGSAAPSVASTVWRRPSAPIESGCTLAFT